MDKNEDRLRLARRMRIANTMGWNPFNDANDDYGVLEWARDNGYAYALSEALHAIIVRRRDPTASPDSYGLSVEDVITDYQIGDYARAAVKALETD